MRNRGPSRQNSVKFNFAHIADASPITYDDCIRLSFQLLKVTDFAITRGIGNSNVYPLRVCRVELKNPTTQKKLSTAVDTLDYNHMSQLQASDVHTADDCVRLQSRTQRSLDHIQASYSRRTVRDHGSNPVLKDSLTTSKLPTPTGSDDVLKNSPKARLCLCHTLELFAITQLT